MEKAYEETDEYKKEHNDYGQMGKYRNYEIKDCARTIREAEEIKADPEKMKYVKKCLMKDASAMQNAITSISGLREKRLKLQEQETDGY